MSKVDKEIRGLQTKEMMKCEGCGEYHPVEDCEVVIIKMIKGKNCSMTAPIRREVAPFREIAPVSPAAAPVAPIVAQEKEFEFPAPSPNQPQKPRRKIIPPGIASMMIGPEHPGFEQYGSKEHRRA
jgi:hypothetical protein